MLNVYLKYSYHSQQEPFVTHLMEIYKTNIRHDKENKKPCNSKTNMWGKEMENMNYSLAFGAFHGFSFEILVESAS